jgi:creatinine amidohydrolase
LEAGSLVPGSRLTRKLAEMTYVDAKKLIEQNKMFFLPIGSTEQHGSAGALGTDHMAAEVIANQLAERLDGIVLPTIPVGASPYHMKFPGSLTVRSDIVSEYLTDVIRSIVKHGAKKIVVCNGHEGNTAAASKAALAVQGESDADVFIANYWFVVYDRLGKEWEGHFGKCEMAMILAYNPKLLDISKGTDPSDFEAAFRAHARARDRDGIWFTRDFTEIAPTGWYAHPSAWNVTQKDSDWLVDWVTKEIINKMKETGFLDEK